MTNDNKTVAEIVKQVRRECNSLPLPNAAGEKLTLVREINDAHTREMAAKDAEIERLRALVGELADNLECCASLYNDLQMFAGQAELNALVAKARKEVKECK